MGAPRDRQLPRWVLVTAVLGSGLLTAWAMWQTGMSGPQGSWGRVDDAVGQVWAQGAPAPVPFASAAAPASAGASMVARVAGAPRILSGTPRPHGDRGPCTNCHTVTRMSGRPVPPIQSSASLPHEYRGICVNCHPIAGNGPVGPRPVAMVTPMAAMPAAPVAAMPAAPMAAPAAPPEVEWLGVEARPGAQGVTVGAADGAAARAGLAPGDLIVSVNGAAISSMVGLAEATQNGNLAQGTVIVRRAGQRLAFELRRGPGPGMRVPAIPTAPVAPGVAPFAAPGVAPARPEVAF